MAWIQLDRDEMQMIYLLMGEHPLEQGVAEKLMTKLKPEDPVLDQDFIEAARKNHGSEGDLEFDDEAVVSYGDDNGAYVMGWKWVYFNALAPVSEIPV